MAKEKELRARIKKIHTNNNGYSLFLNGIEEGEGKNCNAVVGDNNNASKEAYNKIKENKILVEQTVDVLMEVSERVINGQNKLSYLIKGIKDINDNTPFNKEEALEGLKTPNKSISNIDVNTQTDEDIKNMLNSLLKDARVKQILLDTLRDGLEDEPEEETQTAKDIGADIDGDEL